MIPVQITLRNVTTSPALHEHISQKAEKLNRFHDQISRCRIVIETPKKHSKQGKVYTAHIDILVPGKEIVVTHKKNHDIYIAIRDAFDAIARRLEEHSRKRHGHVKTHSLVVHGSVSRVMQDSGYGFIEGVDGNEYYFNETNLSYPHATHLEVGDMVEFIPQVFSEGRQASHILLLRGQAEGNWH